MGFVYISVVHPKGHTHIAYTLHVRNNLGEKEGEWKGRRAPEERRGEELRLDIIKYLKTTTTTFASEIIGYGIGGVSPDTGFQWLQSIITIRRYMESNKETFKMVLLRPHADLVDQSWWSATNNTKTFDWANKTLQNKCYTINLHPHHAIYCMFCQKCPYLHIH